MFFPFLAGSSTLPLPENLQEPRPVNVVGSEKTESAKALLFSPPFRNRMPQFLGRADRTILVLILSSGNSFQAEKIPF